MASAPSIEAMQEPLKQLVRGIIDEMVGDQIRAATQDGIRLGFNFSADMMDKFIETFDYIHPDAVDVLESFRDILVKEGAANVIGESQ